MKQKGLKQKLLTGIMCAALAFQSVPMTALASEMQTKGTETEELQLEEEQTDLSQAEATETEVMEMTDAESESWETNESESEESSDIVETETGYETESEVQTETKTEEVAETVTEIETGEVAETMTETETGEVAENETEQIMTEEEEAARILSDDEIIVMTADKTISFENITRSDKKWLSFTAPEDAVYNFTASYKEANECSMEVYISNEKDGDYSYFQLSTDIDLSFVAHKGDIYYIKFFTGSTDKCSCSLAVNTILDTDTLAKSVTLKSSMSSIDYTVDLSDSLFMHTDNKFVVWVYKKIADSDDWGGNMPHDVDGVNKVAAGGFSNNMKVNTSYNIRVEIKSYDKDHKEDKGIYIDKVISTKSPDNYKQYVLGDYTLYACVKPLFGGFEVVAKLIKPNDVSDRTSVDIDVYCRKKGETQWKWATGAFWPSGYEGSMGVRDSLEVNEEYEVAFAIGKNHEENNFDNPDMVIRTGDLEGDWSLMDWREGYLYAVADLSNVNQNITEMIAQIEGEEWTTYGQTVEGLPGAYSFYFGKDELPSDRSGDTNVFLKIKYHGKYGLKKINVKHEEKPDVEKITFDIGKATRENYEGWSKFRIKIPITMRLDTSKDIYLVPCVYYHTTQSEYGEYTVNTGLYGNVQWNVSRNYYIWEQLPINEKGELSVALYEDMYLGKGERTSILSDSLSRIAVIEMTDDFITPTSAHTVRKVSVDAGAFEAVVSVSIGDAVSDETIYAQIQYGTPQQIAANSGLCCTDRFMLNSSNDFSAEIKLTGLSAGTEYSYKIELYDTEEEYEATKIQDYYCGHINEFEDSSFRFITKTQETCDLALSLDKTYAEGAQLSVALKEMPQKDTMPVFYYRKQGTTQWQTADKTAISTQDARKAYTVIDSLESDTVYEWKVLVYIGNTAVEYSDGELTGAVTDRYLTFTTKEGKECRVSFVTGCDKNISPCTVYSGNCVPEPDAELEKKGYTFCGWSIDSKYSRDWSFSTDKVTDDMTLYAKWCANERDSAGNDTGISIDILNAGTYAYTGKAVNPQVVVRDGDKILKQNVDYKLTVKNNTKACDITDDSIVDNKKPQIIVQGINTYQSSQKFIKCFSIGQADIAGLDMTMPSFMAVKSNNKLQKAKPTVKTSKITVPSKCYTVQYYTDKALMNEVQGITTVGTYYAVIEAVKDENGKYTGDYCGRSQTFTINVCSGDILLSNAKVKAKTSILASAENTNYDTAVRNIITSIKVGKDVYTTEGTGLDEFKKYFNMSAVDTGGAVIPQNELCQAYHTAGDKTLIISAVHGNDKGYVGEIRIKLTVKGQKITAKQFELTFDKNAPQAVTATEYTGKPMIPVIVSNLVSGKDYEVSYLHNGKQVSRLNIVNAGTYTAVIKGINNYSGSVSVKFKINKVSLSKAYAEGKLAISSADSVKYDSAGAKMAFTISYHADGVERTLINGNDYTVSYRNNKNVTSDKFLAYAVVNGKGNFTGTIKGDGKPAINVFIEKAGVATELNYTITAKNIATADISMELSGLTYKNDTIKDVKFSLYDNGKKISSGEYAYKVSEVDNHIMLELTAKNKNYAGVRTEYIAKELTKATDSKKVKIALKSDQNYYYTGSQIRPELTILDENGRDISDSFTVEYDKNISVGQGTIKITGKPKDGYYSSKTIKFKILPKWMQWM